MGMISRRDVTISFRALIISTFSLLRAQKDALDAIRRCHIREHELSRRPMSIESQASCALKLRQRAAIYISIFASLAMLQQLPASFSAQAEAARPSRRGERHFEGRRDAAEIFPQLPEGDYADAISLSAPPSRKMPSRAMMAR